MRTVFGELAALSNFTFLEGASHPHELAEAARALGHGMLGIADRNSVAGLVRGMVACETLGLRFLPGVRIAPQDGAGYAAPEYIAWPTDRAAWGRLCRMLSEARMGAEKGACPIPREAFLAAMEGQVLALVDHDGLTAEALRAEQRVLDRRLALPLFVAVHHRARGDERRRFDALAAMGARLLAAGGTRFHEAGRRRLADVLTAIRLHRTVDTLGFAAEANAEAHLKSEAELRRLFEGHPEALANIARVEAACSFSLRDLSYEYPDEILEEGRSAQETLERRVEAAVAACWPDGVPERVRAQIAHELALIRKLDYAPYFLTVHEIVRFAKDEGILCQGRGSAANSAVCYALGITAVPPDKHDLLFERFISEARDEPPDIDVDFEHERREEVIQHIYRRYGRDRAAIAATVIRYRGRSAIREVGKALGLSEETTGTMAKAVWGMHAAPWEEIAAEQGLDPADHRLKLAAELAREIEDFPRHLATHVGGFVITRGKLTELCVVAKAAMADRHTIEWDKDDIEALRMLKVDVLGLGMLSCIRRCMEMLGLRKLTDIPQDDRATYAMLQRADSVGVFQIESRAQMNMLPRMRPEKFYDLVIEVAIVRPGPIQGDMVHPYLRRRNGEESVEMPPGLEGVLSKTLGVPLFQEQAMKIAIVGAGFSATRADELRRAMATFKRNGNLPQFREEFLAGMARNGHDPGFAERCFKQLEGFGTYGFPESHAASFAQLVYSSAWLKCHHPAAFAAALLNSQPMGFYAPAQIVRDARDHGVRVLPADVNASGWECSLEEAPEDDAAPRDIGWAGAPRPMPRGLNALQRVAFEAGRDGPALRLGLRLVTGLAEEAACRIGKARPFRDLTDLVRRARLDRGSVEKLARADALRGLGLDRRAALWEAAAVERAVPLEAPVAEQLPLLPEPTAGEKVVLDYLGTGLTLGPHPLALLRPRLREISDATTADLGSMRHGRWLRLAGLVLVRQRPGSAKGVVFFTVEDEFGTANLVLFPDIADRFRNAVATARLIVAEGRLERTEAAVPILHLRVREFEDHTELLRGLQEADLREPSDPWRRTIAHADEVERPNLSPDPRARKAARDLPVRSRDFR
ncbi:MAG: error-prone DNA polymerase [Acetobacteraceae bacterium]|nr:error-prone DNA polymerase [Acetobacteraceae bacterium]